jgi:hypothetical protein
VLGELPAGGVDVEAGVRGGQPLEARVGAEGAREFASTNLRDIAERARAGNADTGEVLGGALAER